MDSLRCPLCLAAITLPDIVASDGAINDLVEQKVGAHVREGHNLTQERALAVVGALHAFNLLVETERVVRLNVDEARRAAEMEAEG